MADIKPQVYKDPRPAEYFEPFHDGRAARASAGPTSSCASSSRLPTLLIYPCAAIGVENVPAAGP